MIDKIITPYIEKVKVELQVQFDQRSLLTWDASWDASPPIVQERLAGFLRI